MLSKWRINNFKSIKKMDRPLEFAPLTIFCGTNSSGKSSVLQSLLLMKQSLRMNTDLPQIALNGDIVKLGTINEVKSAFSKNDADISVEYEIEQEKKKVKFGFGFDGNGTERIPNGTHINIENQDGSISFNFDKGGSYNTCRIELCFKGTNLKYAVEFNTNIDIIDSFFQHFPKYIVMPAVDLVFCYLFEDINVMKKIANMDEISKLPTYKSYTREHLGMGGLKHLWGDIDAMNEKIRASSKDVDEKACACFKDLFGCYLENDMEHFISLKAYNDLVPFIRELLKKYPNIRSDIVKDRARIEKEIRQIMGRTGARPYIVPFSQSFKEDTIAIIQDFFGRNLFYLGPLRAEPAKYDAGGGFLDGVGFKGENTAAYYANNIEKFVEQISTMSNTNCSTAGDIPIDGDMTQVLKHLNGAPSESNMDGWMGYSPMLSTELSFWLQYIGVADSIEVKNEPIGSYIKIIQGKGKNKVESLLNNVGVGVSQILPILIQCLAADDGSTIIIEQPELHLHPKMQTRLADFFLAMSLTGKQIIIETHSEYIVDQLRLRIVQAPLASPINDKVAIYFTEKHNGNSEFRRLFIDEFSTMSEWPEGFFEDSMQIAREILSAARKKEKDKGLPEDDND